MQKIVAESLASAKLIMAIFLKFMVNMPDCLTLWLLNSYRTKQTEQEKLDILQCATIKCKPGTGMKMNL